MSGIIDVENEKKKNTSQNILFILYKSLINWLLRSQPPKLIYSTNDFYQDDSSSLSVIKFSYLYSKIVQSEQSTYWVQSSDWLFLPLRVETHTQEFYNCKVWINFTVY